MLFDMPNDHSKTKEFLHDFFIFTHSKDTKDIENLLKELEPEIQELNTQKEIYIFEIDKNLNEKSNKELLALVR